MLPSNIKIEFICVRKYLVFLYNNYFLAILGFFFVNYIRSFKLPLNQVLEYIMEDY